MRLRFCVIGFVILALLPAWQNRTAWAINLTIDYTYDSNNFFNPNTTNGAAARASLEAAAGYFSGILSDTFSPVTIPEPLVGVESTFTWSFNFTNPTTGGSVVLTEGGVAADEYRVYAGARNVSGLGVGGPGGWARSLEGTGSLFGAEINEFNSKSGIFEPAVSTRGELSGEYAGWGGAITFDSDSSTNWHFDHTTLPSFGENDFFSVAIHELGHALGFGTSSEWSSWVSNSNYLGPASRNLFGSAVPLDPEGGHWQEDLESVIYGTTIAQETAMDPSITNGTRKLFTALDAAGLDDIGWDLVAPTFDPADFNADGFVNGADLPVWESAFGNGLDGADFLRWQRQFMGTTGALAAVNTIPEPSTGVLLLGLTSMALLRRRRDRLRRERSL